MISIKKPIKWYRNELFVRIGISMVIMLLGDSVTVDVAGGFGHARSRGSGCADEEHREQREPHLQPLGSSADPQPPRQKTEDTCISGRHP